PDIAIEAPDVRGLEIPETILMHAFQRTVYGVVVDLFAPLRRALDASERAAHDIDFGAVIVEAILHLHIDGAAERVQPERGIVGHHGARSDGGGRDQVPVDGV